MTIRPSILAVGTALIAVAVSTGLVEAREPRWQKSRDVCRQLRAEGWKPSPDGPGDPSTGELRQGSIFVCRLRQAQPAHASARPSHLDVFMQHGGGDNLTVIAEIWSAADRAPALTAMASLLARAARELEIALPADMLASVRSGEPWSDEAGGLTFDVSQATRESEMTGRPDAKPNEIPLIEFKVIVEPTP